MDFEHIEKHVNHMAPTEPLTAEQEREFIHRHQQGDSYARKRLIESNIRFVIKLALQFRNQGLSLADLIQEGNLGLIEALDKFKPEKKCRLITYASWWIRLYLQRSIEQKTRSVNLPINKLELIRKVRSFESTFEMRKGRKPYKEEIAKALNENVEKIENIDNYAPSFHALSSQDEEHPGLEKVLVDESLVDQREIVWQKEAENRLSRAMNCLNPREREVLFHRYVEGEGKKLSLRKVGKLMGLSAEGVRRIEEQAMRKLRHPKIQRDMNNLFVN